jgi:hypothetical protein
MTLTTPPRRTVLQVGFAAASVAVVAHACSDNEKEQAEEITPPEDLMREHGMLDRVLLIYDAAIRRLSANEDFDPAVISDSAKLVQDFIQNYHEKSEEDYSPAAVPPGPHDRSRLSVPRHKRQTATQNPLLLGDPSQPPLLNPNRL